MRTHNCACVMWPVSKSARVHRCTGLTSGSRGVCAPVCIQVFLAVGGVFFPVSGLYRPLAYIGLWLVLAYGLYGPMAYIGLWLI